MPIGLAWTYVNLIHNAVSFFSRKLSEEPFATEPEVRDSGRTGFVVAIQRLTRELFFFFFFSILQVTFYLLHWKKGTPVYYDQGKYDHLTFWEQIDDGSQFTSNKKFFTIIPIAM